MIKEIKCKRCYGRGFTLKPDGYTIADRINCPKCDGTGKKQVLVSEEFQSAGWELPQEEKTKRFSIYRRYGCEV